jgi:type I restriction-modification system DNA methylase subunit
MKEHSSAALLEKAYSDLGYAEGDLWDTNIHPSDVGTENWLEMGDWLVLAKRVGAEKILFVRNNPVIVFARCDRDEAETLRQIYNKIWCMARPRLLFLAKLGELAVYDLADKPARTLEEWQERSALDVVKNISEVAETLKAYRREQVESGRLFEEKRFGDPRHRADKSLIQDLKKVRYALIEKDLGGKNLKYAHALIGRSIFIRYLEDRGILTPEYFYGVAKDNHQWHAILEQPFEKIDINQEMENLLYPRVLSDKAFTFALFERLARDFNGDMFPQDPEEQTVVTQDHLLLLKRFLKGDSDPQQKLFFSAYRFDIIPIELISSIYEEFYHVQKGGNTQGSFYTPPALVEFILFHVLTLERLEENPKIMDPACGSGIFLVEAFRRIVRYRVCKQGQRLSFQSLQKILREQIGGIDINPESIRVAAFSLYLAMLHYLEPPDILRHIEKGNCLPHLIAGNNVTDKDTFNILLTSNAFAVNNNVISGTLEGQFTKNCADIVVGNPPWGSPSSKDKEAIEANKVALRWCAEQDCPVGYKERSQSFLWKALELLRPGGICGMLVSTGVFYKHGDKSKKFREKWLSSITLDSVFNFAHSRRVFFKGSGVNAPFAAIVFRKLKNEKPIHRVHYWSAKRTANVESLQAVLFSRNDLKLIRQTESMNDSKLWKIYWWGNHRDEELIRYFEMDSQLKDITEPGIFGQGFKQANQKYESDWLKEYEELPVKNLHRYGALDSALLVEVPQKVERRGVREVYEGSRLLVKRGITEKTLPKGKIIARFERDSFCFRNSIHGIKISRDEEWQYKCVLAILWSSLARYYFFLTSSAWGSWYHEIHEEELLNLPIRFPKKQALRKEIIEIVDRLRAFPPQRKDFGFGPASYVDETSPAIAELENRLDNAIFDLFELSEAERDLVRDLCDTGLEYFYSASKSVASQAFISGASRVIHGTYADLKEEEKALKGFKEYLRIFLEVWNRELEPEGEFSWKIIFPSDEDAMVGVVFSTRKKGRAPKQVATPPRNEWNEILLSLGENMMVPFGSKSIYLDGMVRGVTNEQIIIIKRNENRFWTRSMAREDAEATLVQAMNRGSAGKGIRL